MARKYGEAKRPGVVQGAVASIRRGHNRKLRVIEFSRKAVFFEDGVVAPAIRPVELGDDRWRIFDAHLIHAILIAVQCKKPAVTSQGEAFERFDDMFRLQARISERCAFRGSSHKAGVLDFMAMHNTAHKTLVAMAACIIAACGSDEPDLDLASYEADILQWRAERLERLKGPDGYLNLAGLFWLDHGSSRIGSAADNDIVFPAYAARYVGRLETSADGVELISEPGVDVRYEDIPVKSILISDDTTDNPVTIMHRSFAWTIIKRDGRFALRLRDFDHPAIKAFPPIDFYPIDPAFRVVGTLRRYDKPRVVNVETVIEGLGYRPESPGTVEFEIDGETHALEAYASGDSLFFVFGDATTGRETYPAGRFLYAAVPGEDGKTVMDFNRAYNPPCAFNDFATCPVASARNRMTAAIEAGEKFDPAIHATPGKLH